MYRNDTNNTAEGRKNSAKAIATIARHPKGSAFLRHTPGFAEALVRFANHPSNPTEEQQRIETEIKNGLYIAIETRDANLMDIFLAPFLTSRFKAPPQSNMPACPNMGCQPKI